MFLLVLCDDSTLTLPFCSSHTYTDIYTDMDPLWTPYGPPMDPLWTSYCPPIHERTDAVDPLWTPYGPPMDPLWTPYGPPIDPP